MYNGQPIYDFFLPVDKTSLQIYLEPVSVLVKKNTYIGGRASVTGMLAQKFFDSGRPVKARYFEKFLKLQEYTRSVADLPYKFENHLDGRSVKQLFKDKNGCPE
jgi:hypothetical protein